MRALLLALFCLIPLPALAQDRCLALVNGGEFVISPDLFAEAEAASRRERWLGWPGRLWDRAAGRPPECDSGRTIAFLGAVLGLHRRHAMLLEHQVEGRIPEVARQSLRLDQRHAVAGGAGVGCQLLDHRRVGGFGIRLG